MSEENWANDYTLAAQEGLVEDPRFVGGDDGFGEIDFDSDGIAADDVGAGDARFRVKTAGWYHFTLTAKARPLPYGNGVNADAGMDKKRKPDILLECCVIASEKNGDPIGSVHFHNLVLGAYGGGRPEDYDREQTLNVLVGLGICKKVDGRVIDPETGTTAINTRTLTDRLNKVGHFIGHIQFQAGKEKPEDKQKFPGEKYPDTLGFQWGRGLYLPNDPAVANAPKSADPKYAVKMATPPAPPAGNGANGTNGGKLANGSSPAKDGEPRKDANNGSRNQPVSASELDDLQL